MCGKYVRSDNSLVFDREDAVKQPEKTQRLKILHVVDNQQDRDVFKQISAADPAGYCISECTSPDEALAAAINNSEAFDAVAINHDPAGLDGLALCQKMLAAPVPLPLVLLTGSGQEKIAAEALQAGVSDYLIKDPYNAYLDLLPFVLNRVVANHREKLLSEDTTLTLRQNQDRLLHIVEGITIPTFVINKNHIVTHWNQACANITGVPAAEVIGTRQQWRAFYSFERPVMADLIVDQVIEHMVVKHYGSKYVRSKIIAEAFEAEDFFPHFGEAGKWLYFTAAPLKDDNGQICGAIETLQDVSDRRKAELALKESERLYRDLSITDGLTKLYNSRHFFGRTREEIERCNRYASPLSLILLDVDNFKGFNDTYGHIDGDRVLAGLADVIRDSIRGVDSAYRYGGEEFIVLFPETEPGEAALVAERIRQTFEQTIFSPEDGVCVTMTISIGGGSYHGGEDLTSFVKRIDGAMYEAKRRGKNRVVFVE